MSVFDKLGWLLAASLFTATTIATASQINGLQFTQDAQYSRLIFKTPNTVSHGLFLLKNPNRLVLDFKQTQLTHPLTQPPSNHPLFLRIRSAQRHQNDLRIVVDLKKAFTAKDIQVITNNNQPNQLLISINTPSQMIRHLESPKPEIQPMIAPAMIAKKIESTPVKSTPIAHHKKNDLTWAFAHQLTAKDLFKKQHEIVIAIDAGHGGNDVGAQGTNGTQEKNVVFAIAQRLEQIINNQSGMRAVMVRKGDYYIKLRDRMEIARQAKADLFVSIHADAINDSSVKGASVYMLSNTGASSEAARWLANSENASDLMGGVSLGDKDDILASVLLDLSQSATKEASRSVANKILQYFNAIGKLHKNEVQKANFMVLKSPDIPSILIETAFISNPDEELELVDQQHQQKIADAVFKGIHSYFKEYAPTGTRMAASGNHAI